MRQDSRSRLKLLFLFRCRVRQTAGLDSEEQKQRCVSDVKLLASLAEEALEVSRVPAEGARSKGVGRVDKDTSR